MKRCHLSEAEVPPGATVNHRGAMLLSRASFEVDQCHTVDTACRFSVTAFNRLHSCPVCQLALLHLEGPQSYWAKSDWLNELGTNSLSGQQISVQLQCTAFSSVMRKGRVGAGRILMPTHRLHRGVAHIHCTPTLVPPPPPPSKAATQGLSEDLSLLD